MVPSDSLKRAAEEAMKNGDPGFYFGKVYYIIGKSLPDAKVSSFYVVGDYCIYSLSDTSNSTPS